MERCDVGGSRIAHDERMADIELNMEGLDLDVSSGRAAQKTASEDYRLVKTENLPDIELSMEGLD